MKRHTQMIFTKQPRVPESCQTAGTQNNPRGTRRIGRKILLGAITIMVVLGAREARAQAPNAALRVGIQVDNGGNTTAPKTVGDFEFTVSRPDEPPLFKFHGSEQLIRVPLTTAADTAQGRTFVLRNINAPSGYVAVYEGDCNPAGGIELLPGEVKECQVTIVFVTYSLNGATAKILKIIKHIDNTDISGGSVPQAASFSISVVKGHSEVLTTVRGSETGINIALPSQNDVHVREEPSNSFPKYLPSYDGDCGRNAPLGSESRISICVVTNAFLNKSDSNPTGVLKIITQIETSDVPGQRQPQPQDLSTTIYSESQPITSVEGSESGINIGLATRSGYRVRGNSNPQFPDYFPVFDRDCNQYGGFDLGPGELKTCVVKFLYINSSEARNPESVLKVIKRVDNTGLPGETTDVRNFVLNVRTGTGVVTSFSGSQTGFNIGLPTTETNPFLHIVSEAPSNRFPNYVALFSGDCDSDRAPEGFDRFSTCVVTNYSVATTETNADAVLKIIPVIDNTAPAGEPVPQTSDFLISVSRGPTTELTVHSSSAGANIGLRGGMGGGLVRANRNPQFPAYLPSYSDACERDGQINLQPGEKATCVVTFSYLNATENDDSNGVIRIIKELENVSADVRPRTASDFRIGVFRGSDLIQSVQGSESGRNVGYDRAPTLPILIREINPPADYIQLYSGACQTTDRVLEVPPILTTCVVTNVFVGARPPVANNQTTSVNEDTTKAITLTASDPNGNPLSYSVVSPPLHGRLSGNAPNLVYTPDPNFNGADSFAFIARDSQFDSNTATVFINVLPVNDVPVATGRTISAITETSTQIQLFATDVDGDALTVSSISRPAHGTVTVNGLIATYTSADNYLGQDSFTYIVSDGSVSSVSATVIINVINGITIGTVSRTETNLGINRYVFNVQLLAPTSSTVTFQYATANGTAVAGSDYTAKSGTLSFGSGLTAATIIVDVAGDQLFEIDEVFVVQLSNPVNAVLRNSSAAGVIINDDPQVGISEMNPSNATVEIGERVNLALTWTHPERWRLLDTIDFRIIDDQGSVMWVRFSEPSNTFSLFNPTSGTYGNPVIPGSPQPFETNAATMYVEDSRVQGSGPTGPSVVLTYSLGFKPQAAGRVFRVEAFATDDFGHQQGFDLVGTVTVQPQR